MIVNYNKKCEIVYNPDLSYNIFKKGKNFDTKKLIDFFETTICNEYCKSDNNICQFDKINIPELNNYITQNMKTENKKPKKLKVFILTENRDGQVFSNKRVGEGKGSKTMVSNPEFSRTFKITTNSPSVKAKFGSFLKGKKNKSYNYIQFREIHSYINNIKKELKKEQINPNNNNKKIEIDFDIGFIYLSNSKNSMIEGNDQLLQTIYYDICWRNKDMKDTFNLYRVSNGTDRLGVIVKASLLNKIFKPMSSNTTSCKKYTSLVATKQENNTIKFSHSSNNNNENRRFAFDCSGNDITVSLNINGREVEFDKDTTLNKIKEVLTPINSMNEINNNEMYNMLKRMQEGLKNNNNNNAKEQAIRNLGTLYRNPVKNNTKPSTNNPLNNEELKRLQNVLNINNGINYSSQIKSVQKQIKLLEQKEQKTKLNKLKNEFNEILKKLEEYNKKTYIPIIKEINQLQNIKNKTDKEKILLNTLIRKKQRPDTGNKSQRTTQYISKLKELRNQIIKLDPNWEHKNNIITSNAMREYKKSKQS
jgi:hypothetical protein